VETTASAYTLASGEQNLKLVGSGHQSGTGNGLDNLMISNDAQSTLSGLAGSDTLVGGRGGDTLTGGDGADVFSFKVLPWSPATIKDFALGVDKIDFHALLAASGYTGTNPIADHYVLVWADAGGSDVLFDPDGDGPQYPWLVADVLNVSQTQLSATSGWLIP
jgi:Ca2+-binding RTX toxin-like protein